MHACMESPGEPLAPLVQCTQSVSFEAQLACMYGAMAGQAAAALIIRVTGSAAAAVNGTPDVTKFTLPAQP